MIYLNGLKYGVRTTFFTGLHPTSAVVLVSLRFISFRPPFLPKQCRGIIAIPSVAFNVILVIMSQPCDSFFVAVIKLPKTKRKTLNRFLPKIVGRFRWENRVLVRCFGPNATDNLPRVKIFPIQANLSTEFERHKFLSYLDMDECLEPDYCNNGRCENFIGGFNCSCNGGFARSEDQTTCEGRSMIKVMTLTTTMTSAVMIKMMTMTITMTLMMALAMMITLQ